MASQKTNIPLIPALSTLAFGLGLTGFAALGSFMRLSGDDYCYSGVVTQQGFWNAQVNSYLTISTYHGGRFSLTLLSGLATLLGSRANGFLPALALILWGVGAWFTLRQMKWTRLGKWGAAWMAACLVFTVVYQAPDRVQSVYWRSGMLPYAAPLVGSVWLAGLALWYGQRQRSRLFLAPIFLLGVLSGGFSETGAAFQAALFGFWALVIYFLDRRDKPALRRQILPTLAALAGILTALALLWLSPVTRMRQASLPAPENLLTVLGQSFWQTYVFARASLRSRWLSTLALMVVTGAAGWLIASEPPRQPGMSLRKVLLSAGLWSVAGIVLIAAVMAPSFYAQSSAPDPRALLPAQWALVAWTAGLAWLAGQFVGSKWILPPRWETALRACVILAVIGASVFPLNSVKSSLASVPGYQRWASFWDERDQAIRDARNSGAAEVEVVQIDHIVPDVAELSPDDGYWYNVCAADYYDIGAIRADLEGWDD